MNRNFISGLGLFLLALAFVMVILLNNLWFSGIRVDLTENKLFT